MIYFIGNSDLIESEIYTTTTIQAVYDYFIDKEWIAVDTETEGKDSHIKKLLTIQLGDFNNQFVIDVRYINVLLFKELLESKSVIIHNAKFDYKFFKSAGIILNNIWDTMLAECVIFCGYEKFGYGLDKLCQRYLNIILDKTTRGEFFKTNGEPFTAKQIEYAALDVKHLHQIKEMQEALIDKYDLRYCINIENEAVKALADIEYNGMLLDSQQWLKNTQNTQIELDAIQNQLDELVLNDPILSTIYKPKYVQTNLFDIEYRELDINYASSTQILKILHFLGFQVEDTNDRTLQKIKNKHKFVEVLISHRELSKVISTYGEGFINYINKHTGRIHTSFWQVLNTGRISSGSKDDNAPNLQNIPADNKFRNCFKAREGFLWVSIDYSGQELRLMADGSNEQAFIDVLNSGEDLHCFVGSIMYGKTITKADKKERTEAKTINFGKPYGMGPPKLADLLGISIEDADELFKIYASKFPTLESWLKSQSQFAKKHAYSVTFAPCKRRRWYPEIREAKELRKLVELVERGTPEAKALWKKILQIEGSIERNGGNQPIQGSGADICKEALIQVRNLIIKYNQKYSEEVAFLICTVHDAIDVEVREDLAKEFAKEMEELMVQVGNKYVTKVKMEVDTTITKFWQK